ncbi:MAG: hypothetical protein AAGC43_18590, partial [Bacteroidota bacterium]
RHLGRGWLLPNIYEYLNKHLLTTARVQHSNTILKMSYSMTEATKHHQRHDNDLFSDAQGFFALSCLIP